MPTVRQYSDTRWLYKRFNCSTIPRTLWGTITRYLSHKPLVQDDVRLSILTFTIYPELARLWWRLWLRVKPADVPCVIVDSVGTVNPAHFPGAIVCRFVNKYHGWKADQFIRYWIRSRYVWLMDDDKFIVDAQAVQFAQEAMDRGLAALSFAPRILGWRFNIDGRIYRPMGTYCVLLNREVLRDEQLPLAPAGIPNPHKPPGGEYDTLDYAHEQLIRRGYEVVLHEKHDWITGFDNTSVGRIYALYLSKDEVSDMILHPVTKPAFRVQFWSASAWNQYAVCKVSYLYRSVFNEDPRSNTALSEQKIRKCVERAEGPPDEAKERVLKKLDAYDDVAERVLQLLG